LKLGFKSSKTFQQKYRKKQPFFQVQRALQTFEEKNFYNELIYNELKNSYYKLFRSNLIENRNFPETDF